MTKDTESKIRELQLFEQNIQNLSVQKQQFQSQVFEVDSAISELKSSSVSYKIIGNIMIKADKASLSSELIEKKEVLSLRIASIEKQEKALFEKASNLQKEVLAELKKEGQK